MRFRCHCTKCQEVYQAPFSDGLVFRRGQVSLIDPGSVKWIKTLRPSPLYRGICASCDRPVLAHLYGLLSIVPAHTVHDLELPEVSRDLYYGTRVADLDDGLPKHETALSTYLGCAFPFTGVLMARGKAV